MSKHQNNGDSLTAAQLVMLLHSGSILDAPIVEKVLGLRLQPTPIETTISEYGTGVIVLTAQNRNIVQYDAQLSLDTIKDGLNDRTKRSILHLSKIDRATCIDWSLKESFLVKLGEVQRHFNFPPRLSWKILYPVETEQYITVSPSVDNKCVESIDVIQNSLEQ